MASRVIRTSRRRRKSGVGRFLKHSPWAGEHDKVFTLVLAGLLIFGLAALSSASSAKAYQEFGSTFAIVWRQILNGILPGLLLFYIFSRVDYHRWQKYRWWLLGASIFFLVIVFIPGISVTYGRARSWVGFPGFNLQPGEFFKLSFILFLAAWLADRDPRANQDLWLGLLPFIVFLGIPALLIAAQPDPGTMAIVALTALAIFYIAGARLKHLAWLAVSGVGALTFLVFQAPYRLARITAFLQPEIDQQGVSYHINQALLAIGSGGLFGRGFGQSRQKFAYLPEVSSDSIFAIIGEEMGFIMAGLVVVALGILIWRILIVVRQAPDNFGKLVATGVAAWIFFQSLFNIGAMLGLLPITGVPLPFISQGGSAMVGLLAACGLIINISRQSLPDKKFIN